MANSIYYLLVGVGAAGFCVATVMLLQAPFSKLATAALGQLDIILNTSLNEDEKDRLLIKNLFRLLRHFFKTFTLFALLLLAGAAPAFIYAKTISATDVDLSSFYFYLSMLAGSAILLLFKDRKSDYPYWSRLLHALILDHYQVGKYLFRRELRRSGKPPADETPNFVVVSGLARAGTTALTNLLFDAGAFHSISYANMPFLLAPNTWKKIYSPKSGEMNERAHGDKVMVGKNSIEAFDEYFFKAFLNDAYIHKFSLKLHSIDEQIYRSYLAYQELFRKGEKNSLYLAKNNNFMLRYKSMRQHNRLFKLILVFRNPAEQAHSLMRQDQNFVSMQNRDPFVLDYMNWLGHYEFGLNQKLFDFGGADGGAKYTRDSLDYWIAIWIHYYRYILQFSRDENVFFVHHTDLLDEPEKIRAKLADFIPLDLSGKPPKKFAPGEAVREQPEPDAQLLSRAGEIYQKLLSVKIDLNT